MLEFCRVIGVLLIDADTVYDPSVTNDRPLLGGKAPSARWKWPVSASAPRRRCDRRPSAGNCPHLIGYVKTVEDRIEKDPDARRDGHRADLSKRRWQARGRSICGWISSRSCCPSRADPMTRGRSSGKPARIAVLRVLKNLVRGAAVAAAGHDTAGGRAESRPAGASPPRRVVGLDPDHHDGYIRWDVCESNQTTIAYNNNA